ncbi:hypothetical protein SDC9_62310 [bioreactor metagenome]|uniref:HTH cro/C1-type domain-containing protein n=1 Tax=bioreactor metagenome TaxID=1076179 RepID=A0A644XI91_9ZZZZ
MKLAQSLIDKAVEMCGSAAELARRMECYPADISNLRSGKRPLSPELAAEIAEIAKVDARQAAIDAIIERNAANRKGALLADILGKGQAVGAAAMLGSSYTGDSIVDTAVIKNDSASVNKNIHRIYQWLIDLLRSALARNTANCFTRTA